MNQQKTLFSIQLQLFLKNPMKQITRITFLYSKVSLQEVLQQ
jgi:hypothetical protein